MLLQNLDCFSEALDNYLSGAAGPKPGAVSSLDILQQELGVP